MTLSPEEQALIRVATGGDADRVTVLKDHRRVGTRLLKARVTGCTATVRIGRAERVIAHQNGDAFLRASMNADCLPELIGTARSLDLAVIVHAFVPGTTMEDALNSDGAVLVDRLLNAIDVKVWEAAPKYPAWKPRHTHQGPIWARIDHEYRDAIQTAGTRDAPHGASHGDLHLGNVVATPDGRPVLIDLGGAKGDECVLRDYASLEAHLAHLGWPALARRVRDMVSRRFPLAPMRPWRIWAFGRNWSHQQATDVQRRTALAMIFDDA